MEVHPLISSDFLPRQPTREPDRSFVVRASIGITHLLVASIGVGAATACALYATQAAVHPFIPSFGHHLAAQLLLTLPGYPLQALDGLFLGFLLAKRLGGRISRFAWVAPLGVAVLVWLNEPERSIFFEHLRSDGTCRPGASCFNKAVLTLMVVSSTFYSMGAIAGMRKRIK